MIYVMMKTLFCALLPGIVSSVVRYQRLHRQLLSPPLLAHRELGADGVVQTSAGQPSLEATFFAQAAAVRALRPFDTVTLLRF